VSAPNHVRNRSFQAALSTWTKDPNTFAADPPTDLGIFTWVDKRGSVENPAWNASVKSHKGATTPCSGERYTFLGHTSGLVESSLIRVAGGGARETTRRYAGDLITPNDIGALNHYVDPILEDRVDRIAVVGFLNKAANTCRSLQGGVFIGEIKETLHLLTRPGKGIRLLLNEYHRDVKRRLKSFKRFGSRIDPSYIKDANKVVSDTWLEWSFGLKPLMSDVKSGSEALAELATRAFELKHVSFYYHEGSDALPGSSYATYIKAYNLYTRYTIRQKAVQDISSRIIGQVICEVLSPIAMADEILGITPQDIIPTIWELIPYSFLVDYFTNMGDVIQAWSFPQQKLAWHNKTIRRVNSREIVGSFLDVANADPNYIPGHHTAPSVHVKISAVRFDRSGNSLGIPTLVFQIPGFSTKWMNIAALAHMRS